MPIEEIKPRIPSMALGEEPPVKEEEPPKPPPPVQPEEFFPGFGALYREAGVARYRARERVEEVQKRVAGLKSQWLLDIPLMVRRGYKTFPLFPFLSLRYMPEEEFERQQEESRTELDFATQEFSRFSWRQNILGGLPYLLADRESSIRSVEDIYTAIPNEFLRDEDRQWLEGVFTKLEYLIPPELPPEFVGEPAEVRSNLLEQILAEPTLEMKAVHNLTVEELMRSFQTTPAPLPPGMTPGDVRDILSELQFDTETQESIDDLHSFTEEMLKAIQEEAGYIDLLRAGLVDAEAPELTPWEFTKMLATQPALATLELLEKYFNALPRPLAAMAVVNFPRIRPDSDAAELEQLFDQYREMGEGMWGAYSEAYQNWGTNIWLKMFIETMFDPTTYIGLGIATRIAKPIPILGKFVGATERGVLEAADIPFKILRRTIRALPKTSAMQASLHGRQAFKDLRTLTFKVYGKDITTVSVKEMQDIGEMAVKQVFEMPQETGNQAVRFGRYLLEQDFIEEPVIRGWLKQLGKKSDITMQRVVDINDAAEMMLKKITPPKESAARILTTLGLDQTDELMKKMTKIMGNYEKAAIRSATSIMKGETPKEILRSTLVNIQDRYARKFASPIYTHAQQAGRSTGWMVRVADKITRNNILNFIDRRAVAPMANQYLLFMNLGPYNFIENMMRSWLGGGEMLYPRRFSGVNEAVRMFEGLPNAPYELMMIERELGRLDIAITAPKTGEVMVFKKGKIPGITKELPFGKSINIAGRDFKISSLQDWHDMWGNLTDKQRAYDYMVHYKKALAELAPNELAAIDDVFARYRGDLDGIPSISRKDADDVERVLWNDATVGPEQIRKHDIPLLELERRRAAKEINKVMDRCTDVRGVNKTGIREEVLDGTIFKDIDGRIAAYKGAEHELVVLSLQNETDMLRRLVDDFAEFVPQNSDDLIRNMGFISDIVDGISERISEVRMITRARAAKLTQTEADDFHRASSELLADFLGSSRDDIEKILTHLRAATGKAEILNAKQLTQLDNLAEAIRIRHSNALATRDLDRKIINEAIAATPRNKRDKAFWEALEARRSAEAWEPYWFKEQELFNNVEDMKLGLMNALDIESPPIPPMPNVEGSLTPAHVAYLVGASGDDLYKGLTKVGTMVTIRPREKFITWVYSRARKSASKVGKSPDDIGFTRDAIGDVYDQMFRDVGIDPVLAANEPLTPTMLQLDEVGQELHRIRGTMGIPENDYLKYKGYINKVADEVGNLPMYRTPEISAKLAAARAAYPIKPPVSQDTWTRLSIAERTKLARSLGLPDSSASKTWNKLGGEELRALTTEGMPIVPVAEAIPEPLSGSEAWWATKEKSMTKARELHELAYPTYDDFNVVDSTMRMAFPFWTYESFRWQWLPRTFMRTPGTATSIGRYTDYSDQGYIPMPGTNIQFNPLRGTVFMGGFRRLFLRDYPEYYDAFPGMEIIDFVSRLGFYPGIHIMLPIILAGAAEGKPEWGEIAPAWAKSGLNTARAIAPEAAGKVIDHLFPDRFRDYMTMLQLGDMGYDADELWRKRKSGVKLTEEEEKLWLKAEAKATGLKGILFEQTGIFRLRPEDYTQFREDNMKLIEEITGVPIKIQETIQRRYPVTGKRLSDYFKLDSLQQKILYETEGFERWKGITTPLYPSAWQEEDIRRDNYYEQVEGIFDDYRKVGIVDEEGVVKSPSIDDLTMQWVTGVIGPKQWVSTRGDILTQAVAATREMGKRVYPDVPKTLDERAARLEERGIPASVYSPDQELLYKYYEIEPELRWDWEAGRDTYDFDTYYAKIDIIIDTLQGEYRQRFIDRIQYDWNAMEKLYWQISREYLRPYRMVRNLVLEQYTPEQVQAIRRYEVARGAERDAIRELIGPEGKKLVSHFNSTIREARQRLRMLDPELDAWCYFFGKTDTLLSTQSKQMYSELESKYLKEQMAR